MKINKLVRFLAYGLLCHVVSSAQEKGAWRPANTAAKGITGDVAFAGQKIAIDYTSFTIAQIRELTPSEAKAAFTLPDDADGSGNLFRTSIPAGKTFLHHNTLCGSEETQWVVTWVAAHRLQLAFFSGTQMPVLTVDGLANATALCGTYAYVR